MESGLPTEGYGRGMRQTRRSQRAKEADLNLTGLQKSPHPGSSDDPSIPHKPSSPAPESQTTSDNPTASANSLDNNAELLDPTVATQTSSNISNPQSTQSDAMSQQPIPSIEEDEAQNIHPSYQPNALDLTAGTYATPTPTQQASSRPPIKEEQPEHLPSKRADSSAQAPKRQRVSKPQKSRKKKSTAERAPAEASSKKKRAATPEDKIQRFMTEDELLQPHKLAIYFWEYPVPKDFLNLPEETKAAKARADAEGGRMDDAPELDDWHEFCGLESDLFPDLHLKTSIGLCFASRAKIAQAGLGQVSSLRSSRSTAAQEHEPSKIPTKEK